MYRQRHKDLVGPSPRLDSLDRKVHIKAPQDRATPMACILKTLDLYELPAWQQHQL